MKVLVVQNAGCETLGSLEGLLRSRGIAIDVINAPFERVFTDPDRYSGIVILGGPVSVYDGLPYLEREQQLVRAAVKADTPVLGVCLGSQLIAQATGGRVFKGSKKEIGWDQVLLTPDGVRDIFRGFKAGSPIRVFQWHGDTYDLPPGAITLARGALYPQAFRVGSAVGMQFHLEVDEQMIRLWSREYRNELASEGIDASALIDPGDAFSELSSRSALVFGNFLDAIDAGEGS
jgi:GMP synthase-like glutamine amidotransferase